jgi:predicted helicase
MQFNGGKRRLNLNRQFIQEFSDRLGLSFVEDGKGDLEQTFGPEDVFDYAYAIFHSPTYRKRYAEFLKTDFPRLPLTSYTELFKTLVSKGAELVSLHLMESPKLDSLVTRYPVSGSNTVEKVTYYENNQRVHINKEQYFEGVPVDAWNFYVGGYQVCQKWLKDRKGRNLSYEDINHYQKIIVALKETIRLMTEIDEVIPGWPLE